MQKIGLAVTILAAMAAVAAEPSSARADQANGVPVVPTARQTEIDVIGDILYDSNDARSSRELAQKRGLALADEIGTPQGTLALARQLGRSWIFLNGGASYDFHTVNTHRNAEHVNATGGFAPHFGPCQEILYGSVDRSQTDLLELSSNVVNNTRQSETAGFNAKCGRSIGLQPSVGVTYDWVDNSSPAISYVNSRTLTVNPSLGYARPAFGSVALFGVFADATYPNRPLTGGGAFGYKLYAIGGQYVRPVGARISFQAAVSYTSLNPSGSNARPFHGITYSVTADYAMTSRLKFHAEGSRATLPATRIYADYKIEDNYETDVAYTLGSRLTARLTGRAKHESFRFETSLAPTNDLTSQTIYDALASISYDLSKRIEITLNGGDEERRSNFQPFNYSSTRIGLEVKTKF